MEEEDKVGFDGRNAEKHQGRNRSRIEEIRLG